MKPTAQFNSIEELLPHEPPMILINGLTSYGSDFVEAFVDHSVPSLYTNESGRVPIWVGIEYMAQAMAAFGGLERREKGLNPQIGFLLGTRKYNAYTQYFEKDSRVLIKAVRTYHSEENIVQFRCTITCEDVLLAESNIKAIQPDNPKDVLRSIK